MHKATGILIPVLLWALTAASAATAFDSAAYERIADHYEAIRQALLHDKSESIAEHAGSIASLAPAEAPENAAADYLELMGEIREAAVRLRSAGTLEESRQAFGELSKPMIRLRRMLGDPGSVVVYCQMAEKAWIQPKGEIGNPYYGQSMARCGKIVSE